MKKIFARLFQRIKRNNDTKTKLVATILLIIGVTGGVAPYILSAFGKDPCTEMGIAWVAEIVATMAGYFIRGYKDSKAEADHKLELERLKLGGYDE